MTAGKFAPRAKQAIPLQEHGDRFRLCLFLVQGSARKSKLTNSYDFNSFVNYSRNTEVSPMQMSFESDEHIPRPRHKKAGQCELRLAFHVVKVADSEPEGFQGLRVR